MNPYARARKGSSYSWRCPRCTARAGQPCTSAEGEKLPGVHFERNRERRRAIEAAFNLYRPLGASISIGKGITSFTPLSTRFPKIVLDFREGINYLRNIGGNSPEGEEKMTNCRTFNLDFLSFVAYRNYLSANHFSYSTVRVNADIFAVTVTDSDADCPSAFDHFRAEVVA